MTTQSNTHRDVIASAINEALAGDKQRENATAKVAIAFFEALRDGELKISDAQKYVQPSAPGTESAKQYAKEYIEGLCADYSPQYQRAQEENDPNATAGAIKRDSDIVRKEECLRVIKAVKMCISRAVTIAAYALLHLKADKAAIKRTTGQLYFSNEDDGWPSSVSAFEREARKAFGAKTSARKPRAKGEGTENTSSDAGIKWSDALPLVVSSVAKLEPAQVNKKDRAQLQALLVQLMGMFGGPKACNAIYKAEAKGESKAA